MATREDNVYLAKLSEQAERYDEMVRSVLLRLCLTNLGCRHETSCRTQRRIDC